MVRLEIRFLAAKDGFTPGSFDAMTDRLADAFPALEAAHPWLMDLDLAANLAEGVLTVGVSIEDGIEHPVVETIGHAVFENRGDILFEYWQIGAAIDGVPALNPTEVMYLREPGGADV